MCAESVTANQEPRHPAFPSPTDPSPHQPPTPPLPLQSSPQPPPLDLGRDQLHQLMLESGMHVNLPVTREQLKYDAGFGEDGEESVELYLDEGYDEYDVCEGGEEEEEGIDGEEVDESEEDVFDIDEEINEALRELNM
ncbi:hypothetical protein HDU98_007866 [Podochytrium sp. JEL0797]|nr:hypothetical protein HDU98_007866 [Podochytrium sp. JEL0797]